MNRAGLGLFTAFVSITIAEFLTGSTPLTNVIVKPTTFFLFSIPSLLGLYGCGVILIREAAITWGKGWPSILVMGLAYGIMEEGVAVHTFFQPQGYTVGILGLYGKFLGLDLTWAITISLFHAVYSIAIPILIGNVIWPETRKQRILTRRSSFVVFLLYSLTIIFLYSFVTFKPGISWLITLLLFAAILVYAARKLKPHVFMSRSASRVVGKKSYLILGLVYFPYIIISPKFQISLPWPLLDAEIIVVVFLMYRLLERNLIFEAERKLALLILGLLVPVIVFGIVFSVIANQLGFVAVFVVIYLIYRVLRVTNRPISSVQTVS